MGLRLGQRQIVFDRAPVMVLIKSVHLVFGHGLASFVCFTGKGGPRGRLSQGRVELLVVDGTKQITVIIGRDVSLDAASGNGT
jgi:hypothetical protein